MLCCIVSTTSAQCLANREMYNQYCAGD